MNVGMKGDRMRTMIVHKRAFGLIPYKREIEKPHISREMPNARVAARYRDIWRRYQCEGAGQIGLGATPFDAWNDWAMWALI